ncbi:MAG: dihydroxy-acid dehydratase, partial [Burkholderiales bacterium]
PAIYVPAGPMLRGNWHGEPLGSGSDAWKYWAELRAGTIGENEWQEVEEGIARSFGHCMTMGTASTMTSVAETLGLTLPGAASIPAADANHPRMAEQSGRRIVEMVWEDLKPSDILTRESFDNAITAVHALSGSTNAVIHLTAMAGRAGIQLTLERFDEIARTTPVLANVRPAGTKYLMEDFYYAGGLRALLAALGERLRRDCMTVNGKTLGENIADAKIYNDDVIRPRDRALSETGGLAMLRGNLAPDGAIIKPTAAESHLLKHTGPAVVFRDYNDMNERIDDESLDVDENSVLVLKNGGPLGGPGMPEWGQLPIPKKLLRKGIRDMVRISDARMSGTSYGTCVLHVSPESYVGGPLAFVEDGDLIELDVAARKLELKVSEAELARRRSRWKQPEPRFTRGYGALFAQHVTQADKGCDFDFLHGGVPTPDPEIH